MTLAKALGNGFPIGAVLATDRVASSFVPGSHASAFGGNPLAMAAGLTVMETLLKGDILENCRRSGRYFLESLENLKRKYPFVKEVRGRGLIIGMELTVEGTDIVRSCMEKGLLINCTSGNVLRFIPPLIITEAEVDRAVEILDRAMGER
jgi:acetylornithine/succinyldiaminopimelate/putrescine aminotransferase